MALIKQFDKRSGITYIYESKSYWDKEKKQPRSKRTLVGRLDPVTGEIVPTDGRGRKRGQKKKEAAVPAVLPKRIFFGAGWLLDRIGQETGVAEDLRACFPDRWKQILSIAWYMVLEERKPLTHFPKWARLHRHPCGKELSGAECVEVIRGIRQQAKNRFFRRRTERSGGTECWAFEWSPGRAVIVEENNGLPLHCCRLSGGLPEESALRELDRETMLAGIGNTGIVTNNMHNYGSAPLVPGDSRRFITNLFVEHTLVRDFIEEIGGSKLYYESFREELEQYVFTEKVSPAQAGIRSSAKDLYLHLYYDDNRAFEEEERFDDVLKRLREELISGRRVPEHEDAYGRFLVIREMPGGMPLVSVNQTAVEEAKDLFGFSALISNSVQDPVRALRLFRLQEMAADSFRDIREDKGPFEMGGIPDRGEDGRDLISAVALTFLFCLQRRMEDSGLTAEYTVHELLDELDLIENTAEPGKEVIPAEMRKHFGKLWERLGLDLTVNS